VLEWLESHETSEQKYDVAARIIQIAWRAYVARIAAQHCDDDDGGGGGSDGGGASLSRSASMQSGGAALDAFIAATSKAAARAMATNTNSSAAPINDVQLSSSSAAAAAAASSVEMLPMVEARLASNSLFNQTALPLAPPALAVPQHTAVVPPATSANAGAGSAAATSLRRGSMSPKTAAALVAASRSSRAFAPGRVLLNSLSALVDDTYIVRQVTQSIQRERAGQAAGASAGAGAGVSGGASGSGGVGSGVRGSVSASPPRESAFGGQTDRKRHALQPSTHCAVGDSGGDSGADRRGSESLSAIRESADECEADDDGDASDRFGDRSAAPSPSASSASVSFASAAGSIGDESVRQRRASLIYGAYEQSVAELELSRERQLRRLSVSLQQHQVCCCSLLSPRPWLGGAETRSDIDSSEAMSRCQSASPCRLAWPCVEIASITACLHPLKCLTSLSTTNACCMFARWSWPSASWTRRRRSRPHRPWPPCVARRARGARPPFCRAARSQAGDSVRVCASGVCALVV
jgi:hypothetical protein